MSSAPQLGGLFVGGMPKLKKRGGGVDTGGKKVMLPEFSFSVTSDMHTSNPRRLILVGF